MNEVGLDRRFGWLVHPLHLALLRWLLERVRNRCSGNLQTCQMSPIPCDFADLGDQLSWTKGTFPHPMRQFGQPGLIQCERPGGYPPKWRLSRVSDTCQPDVRDVQPPGIAQFLCVRPFNSFLNHNRCTAMIFDDLFDVSPSKDTPIACDLSVLSDDERAEHEARSRALFDDRQELRKVDGGYAFRFAATMERAQMLLDFIENERRCCPFLTFGIAFEPEERGLWLFMGGDDSVDEYLEQSFEAEHLTSA